MLLSAVRARILQHYSPGLHRSLAAPLAPRFARQLMSGTKRKLSATMPRIGTHSGSFHADEALGCWLLLQTERFKARGALLLAAAIAAPRRDRRRRRRRRDRAGAPDAGRGPCRAARRRRRRRRAPPSLALHALAANPRAQGAEIVRSRDPEVLKELDVVIDVGGTYEPEVLRFDHHQRGFDGASCGALRCAARAAPRVCPRRPRCGGRTTPLADASLTRAPLPPDLRAAAKKSRRLRPRLQHQAVLRGAGLQALW